MKVSKALSIYDRNLQGRSENSSNEELNSLLRIDNRNNNMMKTISKGTGYDTKEFQDLREGEVIKKSMEYNNTNPFNSQSYIPKRKVKFNPTNLLSYSNQNKQLEKDFLYNILGNGNNNNLNILNSKSNLLFNPMQNILLNESSGCNPISEKEFLTFKTNYILKFARSKESYKKIGNLISYISDENKKLIHEYHRKLMNISENKERILFDAMNYNLMSSSNHNQNDLNLNYQNWKECTLSFYELEIFWLKLCEVVLKELGSVKDNNIHLAKKVNDISQLLSNRDFQIEKLNNFIQENDMNSKASKAVKKYKELDFLKIEFKKKENMNIINVNRLEEEIRDLTSLLDKDKDYYNKYMASMDLIESKNKEIEDLRLKYNNDSEEKKMKLAYLNNEKHELNQAIKILEGRLNNVQEHFDKTNKEFINYETQIKILKQTLMEKNENIEMVTEELETWRLLHENEVLEHKTTKDLVQTLEVKIQSMKKDKMKSSKNLNP